MLTWICFIAGFYVPWCFAASGLLFLNNLLRDSTQPFRSKEKEQPISLTSMAVENEITFEKEKIFIKIPLEWCEVVKDLQPFGDPQEDLVFLGHKVEDGKLLLEFRKGPEVFIKNIEIKRTSQGYSLNIIYDDGKSDV